MPTVLINNLIIRTAPSTQAQKLPEQYNSGERILSGDLLIENEGRIWLRYTGKSGNKRYVCAYDDDGTVFVFVPAHIPGPRFDQKKYNPNEGWTLTAYCICVKCCGKSDGITACGYQLTDSDHLLVCAAPRNIPFNTVINVSGGWNGTVIVKDRGGAINGKRLDIFCKTHQEALIFGVKKNCTVNYDK